MCFRSSPCCPCWRWPAPRPSTRRPPPRPPPLPPTRRQCRPPHRSMPLHPRRPHPHLSMLPPRPRLPLSTRLPPPPLSRRQCTRLRHHHQHPSLPTARPRPPTACPTGRAVNCCLSLPLHPSPPSRLLLLPRLSLRLPRSPATAPPPPTRRAASCCPKRLPSPPTPAWSCAITGASTPTGKSASHHGWAKANHASATYRSACLPAATNFIPCHFAASLTTRVPRSPSRAA